MVDFIIALIETIVIILSIWTGVFFFVAIGIFYDVEILKAFNKIGDFIYSAVAFIIDASMTLARSMHKTNEDHS